MTRVYELIDRANILIGRKQLESAMKIINEILCLDPDNLEAWEMYLQVQTTPEGLERAKERVFMTKELCIPDEFGLCAGRYYLIRRIDSKLKNLIP
jgi:hypothetical protein